MNQLLQPILAFLHCQTPEPWLAQAIEPDNLQVLLQDHCTCELKAAQSAALLIRKYAIDQPSGKTLLQWLKPYEDFVYRKIGDGQFSMAKNNLMGELWVKPDQSQVTHQINQDILDKMVRLIKEELHHFEQVLAIMQARGFDYINLSAARYASGLIRHVRSFEPAALIDKLIIGAYIEARSCERFAKLAPLLDDQLQRFYISLLRSEARHYQDYLNLARSLAQASAAKYPQLADTFDQRVTELGQVEAELILSPDPDFRFHSGLPL